MTAKRVRNQQSWESVARDLANRLIFYTYCDVHPLMYKGLAEGCPVCENSYVLECYYARRSERPKPERDQ